MNKDFTVEYKQYMKDMTPDLWDRIEIGLKPKKTGVIRMNKYLPWAAVILPLLVISFLYFGIERFIDAPKPEMARMSVQEDMAETTEQMDRVAITGISESGATNGLTSVQNQKESLVVEDQTRIANVTVLSLTPTSELSLTAKAEEHEKPAGMDIYLVSVTGETEQFTVGVDKEKQVSLAEGASYTLSLTKAPEDAGYDYILESVE